MNQEERIKQLLLTETNRKSNAKQLKQGSIKTIIIALITTAIIFIIVKIFDWTFGNEKNTFNNQKTFISTQKRTHKHIAILLKAPKILPECNVTLPKIDKNSKFYSSFSVNGQQISYKGPSQKWSQLVGYKKIPYNEIYRIKAQIVFSANGHIMLGVTNKNRMQSQSSFFNEDTYAYYSHNGCLWAEGKLLSKDDKGFAEKQVVEITVQLNQGIVQWAVQGMIIGQIYSENLKDQSKQFVPYLEMFQKDDIIRALL